MNQATYTSNNINTDQSALQTIEMSVSNSSRQSMDCLLFSVEGPQSNLIILAP